MGAAPRWLPAVAATLAGSLPKPAWLASTNCGMTPLAREVAGRKLAALGEGAALVRAEVGRS